MDEPLLIPNILEYAATYYPRKEVVSRNEDGSLHRYSYGDAVKRVRQLAHVLVRLGLHPGDRVATLAWNNFRHFELYYAVPGAGFVCHTINPRLFSEQLEYIINDAGDRLLFVDPCFAPLVAKLLPKLPSLRAIVVMCDRGHMPAELPGAMCYDDLLATQLDVFPWPRLDERTASGLCYTSGTTGDPKGVLYSHRSTVLHAMALNQPGLFGFGPDETIMPVVPMFHVNAWCMPYSAPLAGARLVFPGPRLDGASLVDIIQGESVTISAGVPTVWLGLLNHCDAKGLSITPMVRAIVGGAACSQTLIERFAAHGVLAIQGWGMTETSPMGAVSVLGPDQKGLGADEKMKLLLKQGRAPFLVEMRVCGTDEVPLPWDGASSGELEVRGPWIASAYFNSDDRGRFTSDGWFRTGDISTLDTHGFMQIVDRAKDVVKSGGEWISSLDLENVAMRNAKVREAAVIGRADTKWGERPRFILTLHPGQALTGPELRTTIAPHVAAWWIPEDMIIVDELPHGATGKVLKVELRKTYGAEHDPRAIKL